MGGLAAEQGRRAGSACEAEAGAGDQLVAAGGPAGAGER